MLLRLCCWCGLGFKQQQQQQPFTAIIQANSCRRCGLKSLHFPAILMPADSNSCGDQYSAGRVVSEVPARSTSPPGGRASYLATVALGVGECSAFVGLLLLGVELLPLLIQGLRVLLQGQHSAVVHTSSFIRQQ